MDSPDPSGDRTGGLPLELRGDLRGDLREELCGGLDEALRPAPRTHWVVSALAAHFGHDRGAQNEIAVLATGLDQYLQEVFHHLDYPGEGTLPAGDFRALCDVLGLANERARGHEDDGQYYDDDDGGGVGGGGGGSISLLKNLPERLTFRQFHARLCDHFCAECPPGPGERMPVGEENELIEAQIRVRDPLRRRRRTSAVTTTSKTMTRKRGDDSGFVPSPPRGHGETDESSVEEGSEEWTNLLEVENASLRELVEDLRVALQSSDARCLALNVALRKRRLQEPPGSSVRPQLGSHVGAPLDPHLDTHRTAHHLNSDVRTQQDRHQDTSQGTYLYTRQSTPLRTHQGPHPAAHLSGAVGARAGWAQVEVCARRERAMVCAREETARRVRAARSLVASGLARVLQLEALCNRHQALRVQAQGAAPLVSLPAPRRRSPTGAAASPPLQAPLPRGVERHLFRAVEGQEAPGEATDAWATGARGEAGFLPLPDKRPSLAPDCCPYGCRKGLVKQLVRTFSDPEGSREKGTGGPWERIPAGKWEASPAKAREGGPGDDGWKARPRGDQASPAGGPEMVELMQRVQRLSAQLQEEQEVRRRRTDAQEWRDGLLSELRSRREEGKRLQAELQILEAERVRLSLVEEKMGDVLHMMQRLRLLNASRRLLGTILLDTLASCDSRDGAACTEDVAAMLDALCQRLSACDLLRAPQVEPAPAAGQRRPSAGASSLLLSC